MYLRTLLIVIVLSTLVVFAAINWGAFMSQTTLSVGVTAVEAPLGLILLGIVGLLTFLFLVYVVYLQSSALLETRRHARELQAQRELADQAEASRFNQLYLFLQVEMQKLAAENQQVLTAVLGRLEQLEGELRSVVEQSANTLAAYIGEVEDRFERAMSGKGSN